jgi:hypothetical protein
MDNLVAQERFQRVPSWLQGTVIYLLAGWQ